MRTTLNDNAVLLAVNPGTYTITEGAVTNWNLTDITIYETQSATSTSSIPNRSASIVVSAGEVVHVVFENQLTQTTARGQYVRHRQHLYRDLRHGHRLTAAP